ncbi:unnamed protein product [Lactuca saligna]|uniref:Uncharacterized protein n=1 Tax=Lactuca saligna TaxID=75948 RepID=A0AA36ED24_LACSI|nr:unnamed protein product [Lactuca saligna]
MVQSIVTGFAKVVTIHVPNGSIPNGVRLRTDRRQKRPPVRHACDPTNSLNRYLKREIGKLDCTETRLGSGILVLERRFVKLAGNCFYPEKSHRRLISSLSPRFHVSHKGRILEPVEKLKGGLRSRSPRPRSRSPPRRSRSPSRSRSPEGGGNEKASTSSPYSHGRADSRSPLQRSDSNGLPGPMGLMSTSHLEQEAAVLALSTLMTIAPAEVYAEFEKVNNHDDMVTSWLCRGEPLLIGFMFVLLMVIVWSLIVMLTRLVVLRQDDPLLVLVSISVAVVFCGLRSSNMLSRGLVLRLSRWDSKCCY